MHWPLPYGLWRAKTAFFICFFGQFACVACNSMVISRCVYVRGTKSFELLVEPPSRVGPYHAISTSDIVMIVDRENIDVLGD